MTARYADFSNGIDLKECIFSLPNTLGGDYYLDAIYQAKKINQKKDWHYTYEEMIKLEKFTVSNKGKSRSQRSKYKTSKRFIDRLNKERNN